MKMRFEERIQAIAMLVGDMPAYVWTVCQEKTSEGLVG